LLPTNWDIDTKEPINIPIDNSVKNIIIQFPSPPLASVILESSGVLLLSLVLTVDPLFDGILLLYRNIYGVFTDILFIISFTAFAGKDVGAVPKKTIISKSTNNSI
jgi:hypothetical protein